MSDNNRMGQQNKAPGSFSFQQAVALCAPVLTQTRADFAAERVAVTQNGPSLTCTKGCGACCHYGLISSSSLEAFGVFINLLAAGKSLDEIHHMGQEYALKFKRAIEKIGHMPFSKRARQRFLLERLPCPLFVSTQDSLGDSSDDSSPGWCAQKNYAGHCGIYDFRPTICSQFNSTESPSKCLTLEDHTVHTAQLKAGEKQVSHLRLFEQHHFGKSALGHLPLLLAALSTQSGLQAFLRMDPHPENTTEDPHAQGTADFFFYAELLMSLNISLGEKDFLDLELAQNEQR